MKMVKMMLIAAAAATVAIAGAAQAEQVACPPKATPAACAENQAIHDAFLAGSYMGPHAVFVAGAVSPSDYLGSDPDANVRLALRKTINGGETGTHK